MIKFFLLTVLFAIQAHASDINIVTLKNPASIFPNRSFYTKAISVTGDSRTELLQVLRLASPRSISIFVKGKDREISIQPREILIGIEGVKQAASKEEATSFGGGSYAIMINNQIYTTSVLAQILLECIGNAGEQPLRTTHFSFEAVSFPPGGDTGFESIQFVKFN
jgi:hypothetical protein